MTRLSLRMKEIAGVEELREVAEEIVAVLAGVTVEDEHAAGAADGRGDCAMSSSGDRNGSRLRALC